jgi:hypothetical protein
MPVDFYLASTSELDQLRVEAQRVFRPKNANKRIDAILRTLPNPPSSYRGPSHYLTSALAYLDETGLVAVVDTELSEQLGLVRRDTLEFLRPLDSDVGLEDVEAHVGELVRFFHGGAAPFDPKAKDGLAHALGVLDANVHATDDRHTLLVRY